MWEWPSASNESIKKPEAIKCCPWAISALNSHAFPHACRQLWKWNIHLPSFISSHLTRKRYLTADKHGVKWQIIFNTVSGYNKRTTKTDGNKEEHAKTSSETGLNLNLHVVSTRQFLFFFYMGVRGKPRVYCSLLAYCTARFGRSNFGHQMPPRLPTRSAL
jgi:hypothetical protein